MSSARGKTRAAHPLRARRAERLRREIDLLEHMDGRLWRKALIDSGVAVVVIALLLTLTAAKLHYFMYHPVAIITASIAIIKRHTLAKVRREPTKALKT